MIKPSQLDFRPELERWWISFSPPQSAGWWGIFVRPGFGHCYAWRMPSDGVLIALNPCVHRVENAIVFERASEVIRRAKAANERVLVYTRPVKPYDAHSDVRIGRGLFLTCASMIAYLVGVNFSWRCTPYQLYRALLANGAKEL